MYFRVLHTQKLPLVLLVVALLALSRGADAASSTCPNIWSSTLKVGATGHDVLRLQQFLNSSPDTAVAKNGPGSSGQETQRFGAMTKRAVIVFQNKYAADILVPNGLLAGNGVVGPSTRAKLNSLCTAQVTGRGSVLAASTTADMLTISTPMQPAQTMIPANALYVPFTNITLTAGSKDVTVNTFTVERVGPGSDQVFYDVDLNDEDGSVLSTAYFTADHKATFKDAFTIPANSSKTLTVVGDAAVDLSRHGGEMPALQIDALDASSPISGLLPVRGTEQIANATLVIGSANSMLSSLDPNSSRTRYIRDTDITFSAIRINVGSQEDLRLDSITWKQNGTASENDFANIATVVNGSSYPATSENGRFYTSSFPGGIRIPKGQFLELSARGDLLVSGANRTIQFDIDLPTDIALTGLTYGYGIYILPGGNTNTSGHSVFLTQDGTTASLSIKPFFSGSTVTVSSGAPVYIGK